MRRVFAVAIGFWLLVDLLRVWTPSLITIFGQAASTPAELMGAFALGCVVLGALLAWTVRLGVPAPTLQQVLLLVALACRVALTATDGGPAQLWVASAGVMAAVAWTVLCATQFGDVLVEGVATALALAATSHAALGTWGAVWRDDPWGWAMLAAQAVLVLTTLREPPLPTPAPARLALAILPALLLAGIWAANPARGSVVSEQGGPAVVVLATMVAVAVARLGSRSLATRPDAVGRVVPVAAVALTATTALVMVPMNAPIWSIVAHAVGMPALVVLLLCVERVGHAVGGEETPVASRARWAASGGAVLWVVLFFAYYAGYDLGYRADLLVVALPVALTALAVTSRELTARESPSPSRPMARAGAGTIAIGVLLALFGPHITVAPVAPETVSGSSSGLRVVAWNLRMGYGMDGQFDPAAVARAITAQDPDVVLVSEVDRAWLLNGGQDQLAVLARLLDMEAHFGPAADAVWGDAILTDLPVDSVRSRPLDSFGAVTGAQVLSATVTKSGQAYDVLSTHLQPHPVDSDEDGALAQALVVSGVALRLHESGNPTVLGGDFNLEPGDPSWDVMTGTGLVDALAEARPLPTSPADSPEQQIDHVFTSPDLRAEDAVEFGGELSDHRGVAVTLLPGA